jgi:hypothetical protein
MGTLEDPSLTLAQETLACQYWDTLFPVSGVADFGYELSVV